MAITVVSDCISIRAPAKGATHNALHLHFTMDISIRAPAKGATFQRSEAAHN